MYALCITKNAKMTILVTKRQNIDIQIFFSISTEFLILAVFSKTNGNLYCVWLKLKLDYKKLLRHANRALFSNTKNKVKNKFKPHLLGYILSQCIKVSLIYHCRNSYNGAALYDQLRQDFFKKTSHKIVIQGLLHTYKRF